MDELRIEICRRPWKLGSTGGESLPYGGGALTVVHINNSPLIELVRRCELPSARAAGQEGLAGSYRPLWGYRFDPGLFFGHPRVSELRRPDGIVLMGCDCGVVGCWPLECRLRIDEVPSGPGRSLVLPASGVNPALLWGDARTVLVMAGRVVRLVDAVTGEVRLEFRVADAGSGSDAPKGAAMASWPRYTVARGAISPVTNGGIQRRFCSSEAKESR